ncbi:type I-E CRISPR-associated protein Cse2/CasB [Halomonas sp. GD1P12]|uniref:type I-E CRISPR-associated protein Cse2/CasB n=1 Tax=Halomonas sp. GD1P12 TaxID=2982691 RepID=UPI0021E36917|nr:type I-E CRISPR-associated protein Cse2/CasB [Halomonas sp. GD1P12]UYG00322.1 type I-E CRISPR-associated protein Cse2/CasB [Halomonas sp. GD1P12]
MSEAEQQAESPAADEQTTSVERYLYALDRQEAYELRLWWRRLVMDDQELKRYTRLRPFPRGVRAALRRCDTIESVMLTEAFRHLWQALESKAWQEAPPKTSSDQRIRTWAAIAAVASELRAETFDAPLGKRLGEKRPNTGDTPRMSDLRFQQLLDCHTPEELIRRFRRALKLADNAGISVVRLADMVALWDREQRGQYRAEATQRFAFIMSDAYFQARAETGRG